MIPSPAIRQSSPSKVILMGARGQVNCAALYAWAYKRFSSLIQGSPVLPEGNVKKGGAMAVCFFTAPARIMNIEAIAQDYNALLVRSIMLLMAHIC